MVLGKDGLGYIDSNHQGSIFPQADLSMPDLEPIIQDLPDDIKLRIRQAVQESHEVNVSRVHSLENHFRTLYTVSADLINGAMENLRVYGKFVWSLD